MISYNCRINSLLQLKSLLSLLPRENIKRKKSCNLARKVAIIKKSQNSTSCIIQPFISSLHCFKDSELVTTSLMEKIYIIEINIYYQNHPDFELTTDRLLHNVSRGTASAHKNLAKFHYI